MKTQFYHCPKCKSENLSGGNIEIDTDVWQEITCEKCGYVWNDIYLYSHAETPDTCEEIDDNGNLLGVKHADESGNIILEPAGDKDVWGEDPEFGRDDWREDAGNGDTNLGYWEWVEHRREFYKDNPNIPH